MKTLSISHAEVACIQELLRNELFSMETPVSENERLLRRLSIYAHRLPERIVECLTDFRYQENEEGVCLIKGFRIDDEKLIRTPAHWREVQQDEQVRQTEMFLLTVTALLGDAIGWSTQQDGRIVHNILPIKGDEYKQIGSGTLVDLVWHTEEAFHPCRCDYVVLLCLRNNERAATTFSSVKNLQISEADKELLFGANFSIYPDDSHLTGENISAAHFENINRMNTLPAKVPVLFGSYFHPYLCIDPYYMEKNTGNEKLDQALQNITRALDNNLQQVVLEPGDILFLDNYKVVHGRSAYQARFDGTGRWLKRVNIARDLRKSSHLRPDVMSRIIETA